MKCIESIMIDGFVSVLTNREESATFKTAKGLRQGTLCPPAI
jgi:hypothetical protein